MAVSLNTALGAFPITALAGTSYVPLAGGTMTGALTIASGTLTASAPALEITQTWNNAGVQFNALLINATDSASSSISTFFEMQIAGTVRHLFTKGGRYTGASGVFAGPGASSGVTSTGVAINNFVVGIRNSSLAELSWTSGNLNGTVDVALYRDAAATLAQRNGTNAQTFKVYGTTDAGLTNYERLAISAQQGVGFTIRAETLGTGGDNLDIVLTPAGTGRVLFPGGAFINNNGQIIATAAGLFGAVALGYPSTDTVLYRNAAGIAEITNGTAGTWRDLKLRNLLAGGGNGSYVQTPSMTVANLAAAATAGAGARAFVTDANATTFLSTVAAGGANKVPVVSDGTNWLIG